MNYEDFQKLVKLILGRLHGQLEFTRLGQALPYDASLSTPEGEVFFEIKAFLRIGPPQRRQIERVLQRMESLNPRKVVVIAPVDLTPATADWLEHVGSQYQFQLDWHGQNWLNKQLLAFPDVRTTFADSVASRTENLIGVGAPAVKIVTNVDDARKALNSREFSRLLGVRECVWLDVKEGPYRLDDASSAAELLKDVAAFANSEGGLLVIGYRTQVSNGGEIVDDIRAVPEKLIDVDRWRKFVRKNVAPHVRGLKMSWHYTGDMKGIFVIDIPIQVEFDKPFVVPGPDGAKGFSAVGVPIRDADATHWLARSDLQRLLSGGWNTGRNYGHSDPE